jgi:hypothetical protein
MIYVICCGVGSTRRVCHETPASNQGLDMISMWLNSNMKTSWGQQKAKRLRVRPRLESLLWGSFETTTYSVAVPPTHTPVTRAPSTALVNTVEMNPVYRHMGIKTSSIYNQSTKDQDRKFFSTKIQIKPNGYPLVFFTPLFDLCWHCACINQLYLSLITNG